MSIKVMSWVWENSQAGGTDLLVLLAIADHASDDGGNAWPSMDLLARKTRVSERTVRRSLRELESLGELATEPGTGRTSSHYQVLMSQGGQDDRPHPGQGDPPGRTDCPPTPDGDVRQTVNEPSGNQRTSSALPADADPVIVELCEYLAEWIVRNGGKPPTIGVKWYDACRLMIEIDKREPESIRKAIDWCQRNEFWRSNIRSMPKLREKYDTLRLQAQSNRGEQSTMDEIDLARAQREAARRRREQFG